MRSIQAKILSLILISVIVSTTVITCIAISGTDDILEQDSQEYLEALCQVETLELNHRMEEIEAAADAVYNYCWENSVSGVPSTGQGSLPEVTHQTVRNVLYASAVDTKWCSAIYVRLDPDIFPEDTGYVLVKDDTGDFVEATPLNIRQQARADSDSVRWFYEPKEQGGPAWIDAYWSGYTGNEVISYVIPFIYNDTFYGVVGIDVDLEMLSDEVQDIHLYDTGTASLQAADGTWILNQTPAAFQDDVDETEDSDYVTKAEALQNGMTLYLSVPRTEIEQPKLDMLSKIIFAIFLVVLLALALSAYAATKLVKPLKQLTIASQKMADGYLGVNIECRSRDEIGVLAANLKQMVQKLQDNIQYINRLAYHDVLTSTRNRAAYEEQITKLDEQIKVGDAAFGVVVMDINHTKQINDTYGHDVGDTMIAEAAKLIKKSFDTDSIYRIAGDKFVVVLTNTELLNYKELTVQFTKELDHFNEKAAGAPYDLVVAKGIAVFEKGRDLTFADVFRRADNMMCQNKKWIKNQQED